MSIYGVKGKEYSLSDAQEFSRFASNPTSNDQRCTEYSEEFKP